MAQERVLLVDDETELTSVLAERMTSRGLSVDAAASGPEALAKIEEADYDAILLDLAMPGMDGIETLERLLARKPELQVIFLTGQGTLEKGVEAVKLGAKDFLEKPASLDKLIEKIRAAKAEKMVLVEKKMEDEIKQILKTHGW
jgi:DNA-binding NtrC family response regulator